MCLCMCDDDVSSDAPVRGRCRLFAVSVPDKSRSSFECGSLVAGHFATVFRRRDDARTWLTPAAVRYNGARLYPVVGAGELPRIVYQPPLGVTAAAAGGGLSVVARCFIGAIWIFPGYGT